MTVPNDPRPTLPGEWDHADGAVRPPSSDGRYLYPHARQSAQQPGSGPPAYADAWRAAELLGAVAQSGHAQANVHAVIGDELQMPAVWCELGSCISRFTDAAALGDRMSGPARSRSADARMRSTGSPAPPAYSSIRRSGAATPLCPGWPATCRRLGRFLLGGCPY